MNGRSQVLIWYQHYPRNETERAELTCKDTALKAKSLEQG